MILFPNREAAEAEREKRKKDLPPVQSAYKPSGKLPTKALGLMIVGTLPGVPAGIVAGVITEGLGALLTVFCVWVTETLGSLIWILLGLPYILMFLNPIFTFIAMYITIGIGSSIIVVNMGRLGKNRNITMAILFSVISGLIAAIAFGFLINRHLLIIISAITNFELDSIPTIHLLNPKIVGWALVGYIITVVSAITFTRNKVFAAKFCENCELYMSPWQLNPTTFKESQQIIDHLKVGNTDKAAIIFRDHHSHDMDEGTATIFTCPKCGLGYLDLVIQFSAKWPGSKSSDGTQNYEEISESWLIGSYSLNPNDTELFKSSVRKSQSLDKTNE